VKPHIAPSATFGQLLRTYGISRKEFEELKAHVEAQEKKRKAARSARRKVRLPLKQVDF
jgi:hypothetical protein